LGYKSEAVFTDEIGTRKDGAKPLSLSQINRTLDKLHERKFFSRVRKDPWHTCYSTQLDQDQLEKALLGSVEYEEGFHQRRITRDSAFMEKMKQARGSNVSPPNVNGANVSDPPPKPLTERSQGAHAPLTERSRSAHIISPLVLPSFTSPLVDPPDTEGSPSSESEKTESEPEKTEAVTATTWPGYSEAEAKPVKPTMQDVETLFADFPGKGAIEGQASEWWWKIGRHQVWPSVEHWQQEARRWYIKCKHTHEN
jgi:hypothetical protein